MGSVEIYTLEDLKNLEVTLDPFIDNVLNRGECLLLKACKKSYKSIVGQAIAHCCSSGIPFAKEFKVFRPLKVAYLFAEGSLVDWKGRAINMDKMHPANNDNIRFIRCNFVKMYTEEGMNSILEALKVGDERPYDVIIWDCLYKFLFGRGVNDEVTIGQFNANEEYIRNYFNASSVILHHDSEKEYSDRNGNKHKSATSKNAMGHSFLLAHPTHYYTLTKYVDNNGERCVQMVLGDGRHSSFADKINLRVIVPEDDDSGEEKLGITLDSSGEDSNFNKVKDYLKYVGVVRDRGLINVLPDFEASADTLRRIKNKLVENKLIEKTKDDNGIVVLKWIGA